MGTRVAPALCMAMPPWEEDHDSKVQLFLQAALEQSSATSFGLVLNVRPVSATNTASASPSSLIRAVLPKQAESVKDPAHSNVLS